MEKKEKDVDVDAKMDVNVVLNAIVKKMNLVVLIKKIKNVVVEKTNRENSFKKKFFL